jgi:hypothetical protein
MDKRLTFASSFNQGILLIWLLKASIVKYSEEFPSVFEGQLIFNYIPLSPIGLVSTYMFILMIRFTWCFRAGMARMRWTWLLPSSRPLMASTPPASRGFTLGPTHRQMLFFGFLKLSLWFYLGRLNFIFLNVMPLEEKQEVFHLHPSWFLSCSWTNELFGWEIIYKFYFKTRKRRSLMYLYELIMCNKLSQFC